MPRFFVKSNQVKEDNIKIIGNDVNHIKKVLRKNIGENIEICIQDEQKSYLCEIINIDNKTIECKIIEELKETAETNLHIHIFQGLPKADKMELIIQKSVELGVSEITPVAMKRCVVKLNDKDAQKKIERWQKISESSAKQCGRSIVPIINNVINIKNICNECKNYDIVLVAYENEKINKLKDELKNLNLKDNQIVKIALVIGPEGGLELEEVEQLKENGAKIITLGKRILRTETVAINMISIVTYELEG